MRSVSLPQLMLMLSAAACLLRFSDGLVSPAYNQHLALRVGPGSLQSTPGLAMSSEEETPAPVAAEDVPPQKPAVKCPDCDQCDGSGRILGGLGAVLPWVPIKAYRPCPNFIENGGRYQRSGQGLDEIAFGRDSTFKKNS
mmetsp:Transcript_9161/g.19023  ORF Transcript_9161/g.19023 Transcript_9161/m.19023 type:complete len:140 (-) Transcript_9161:784-1203(-)